MDAGAIDTASITAWLDERSDEMTRLVESLVSIATENPPGRELGRCGRFLALAMRRLGIETLLVPVAFPGGLDEACIIRGVVGDGPKTVYFHGHFDVVPAQHASQFQPRRDHGRIYGRGTADMKGGIVSMLYAAVAARDLGMLGGGRIVLHLVCDEETGSTIGTGYLRDHGLIDRSALAMLTPEPTGGVVWHANRGAITLRVDVHGRPAHVGQAYLGVNAFEQMLRIAGPLFDAARSLAGEHTAYRLEPDEARGSMMVIGGAAASGANFNVVPESAWFSIDWRLNPEQDLDAELDRITTLITTTATRVNASVTIRVLQRQPAAATDADHPAARSLADTIRAVEGAAAPFELCPGVLETRWYAQVGVPAFAYGAGRLDVSHGPDEYIDEAALRRCAAVYGLAANRLISG